MADVGLRSQAEETGATFGQNALIKAQAAARASGKWVLADDSGLCVDALDGGPGIHSARWSGGGDAENNARLLKELSGVPRERRTARYRCALALCNPAGEQFLVEGEVEGSITEVARGNNGFGYDPFFEIPVLGKTFGEASAAEKEEISHRARAFRKLLPVLRVLAAGP
jgi:XTP/dITP diphosphohydrolase